MQSVVKYCKVLINVMRAQKSVEYCEKVRKNKEKPPIRLVYRFGGFSY
jgi:hypothetical protein